MNVTPGFADHERAQIAAMYWAAFGPKLGRVLGPSKRAQAFIADVLNPNNALCAREDGVLLGVAGFKTFEGALVGGTWHDLAHHYGWLGSTWRIALLAMLERDTENQRFLMDGIFVSETGKGVGTALLNAICALAASRGYVEVRLDVIDTNVRARALYERHGFKSDGVQHLGPLRHVFGFDSATTMIRPI